MSSDPAHGEKTPAPRAPRGESSLQALLRVLIADGARPAASPALPDGRQVRRYELAVLVAATAGMGVATYYFGWRVWALFASALAGALAVELGFARVRRTKARGGALPLAALTALLLPAQLPPWMAALAAGFGMFFGNEVFGGQGQHLFCPVLLGKGFVMFSYPALVKGPCFASPAGLADPNAWIVCAAVVGLGTIAVIAARPANLHVLAGLLLPAAGLAAWLQLTGRLGGQTALGLMTSNGFLLGACWLACDAATSPRSAGGKWLYGAVIGVLAVLMQSFSNYSEGMMSAVLVGNLLSPTLDLLMGRGAAVEAAA